MPEFNTNETNHRPPTQWMGDENNNRIIATWIVLSIDHSFLDSQQQAANELIECTNELYPGQSSIDIGQMMNYPDLIRKL